MRLIRKGDEPRSLAQARAQGVRYDDLDTQTKADIRAASVGEQAGLCCFCMGVIQAKASVMRIAHLVPQTSSAGSSMTLTWSNLFGACIGGERTGKKSPPSQQHCDVRQGDTVLKVDPTNPQHIASISYRSGGALDAGYEVHSADTEIELDLTANLNLNLSWLCRNRADALDVVLMQLRVGEGRAFSPEKLRKALHRHETPGLDGSLPPYAGFVAWWLRKRLGNR